MSVKEMKNVAASVLARLRNVSKSSGAPFQQVLQQYAIERFLYRISKSTHVQGVVLKGALLLKTIGIQGARPTVDSTRLAVPKTVLVSTPENHAKSRLFLDAGGR
jgi:hypothetical protein